MRGKRSAERLDRDEDDWLSEWLCSSLRCWYEPPLVTPILNAHYFVTEIAFVGKAPGTYAMLLGGGYYGQRLNKIYRG
jgi:hypothetical protein